MTRSMLSYTRYFEDAAACMEMSPRMLDRRTTVDRRPGSRHGGGMIVQVGARPGPPRGAVDGPSVLLGRAGSLARFKAKSSRPQAGDLPILLLDLVVQLRERRFRRHIIAAQLVEHLPDGELGCFSHGSTS